MAALIFEDCTPDLFFSPDDALSINASALSKMFREIRVMTHTLENPTTLRRSQRLAAQAGDATEPDQSDDNSPDSSADPTYGVRQALSLLTDVVTSLAAAQASLLSTLGLGHNPALEKSTTAIVSPAPIFASNGFHETGGSQVVRY